MRTLSEGYAQVDPLKKLAKDPERHYILASSSNFGGEGYMGYSTQVDYFEAMGYVREEADPKLITHKDMVLMSISKKEREKRNKMGVQETLGTLHSQSEDNFLQGESGEIKITRNEFDSKQWSRGKPKRRGRPPKVQLNG